MALTRQSTELERGVERQVVLQIGPLVGIDVRPSRMFVWYGSERGDMERIVSLDKAPRVLRRRATPALPAASRHRSLLPRQSRGHPRTCLGRLVPATARCDGRVHRPELPVAPGAPNRHREGRRLPAVARLDGA